MQIPSPFLVDADETSITLSFKPSPGLLEAGTLHLEYRLPHANWEQGSRAPVDFQIVDGANEPKITVAVFELLPGTPYIVRLCLVNESSGATRYSSEVVFDTAPIGCVPKKKKKTCVIT